MKIWKKKKKIKEPTNTFYKSTYIKEFIINSSHIVSLNPISSCDEYTKQQIRIGLRINE